MKERKGKERKGKKGDIYLAEGIGLQDGLVAKYTRVPPFLLAMAMAVAMAMAMAMRLYVLGAALLHTTHLLFFVATLHNAWGHPSPAASAYHQEKPLNTFLNSNTHNNRNKKKEKRKQEVDFLRTPKPLE